MSQKDHSLTLYEAASKNAQAAIGEALRLAVDEDVRELWQAAFDRAVLASVSEATP